MRIFLKTLYLSIFFGLFLSFQANAQILLPEFEPPTPIDSLNSEAEEAMAIPFLNGEKIYFVRTYIEGSIKQRRQAQDIWSAERKDGTWSAPQNLGNKINSAYDETTPFLANDGRTLYFSSNNLNGIG